MACLVGKSMKEISKEKMICEECIEVANENYATDVRCGSFRICSFKKAPFKTKCKFAIEFFFGEKVYMVGIYPDVFKISCIGNNSLRLHIDYYGKSDFDVIKESCYHLQQFAENIHLS